MGYGHPFGSSHDTTEPDLKVVFEILGDGQYYFFILLEGFQEVELIPAKAFHEWGHYGYSF